LFLSFRIAPRVAVSRVASYSTASDKLEVPGSSKDVDPKIVSIVDQISGLTLLQTADLVSLLKVKKKKTGQNDPPPSLLPPAIAIPLQADLVGFAERSLLSAIRREQVC